MQLRRRLVGGGAIGLSAVLAVLLCASLSFAAPASAKVAEYSAPIPRSDGKNSSISFKLKSKKNHQTKKFEPVGIKKFSLAFVLASCAEQDDTQVSFTFPDLIPVSHRKFSLSDTRGDSTLEISGRVPRNGPPKGTVRLRFTSGAPGNPQCDTGTKAWTAKRLAYGTL
jgi:hypothetical protein